MTDIIDQLDAETREWTRAAARGETGWACADCGAVFQEGMPDQCVYGRQHCTDIITRDKARAYQAVMDEEARREAFREEMRRDVFGDKV